MKVLFIGGKALFDAIAHLVSFVQPNNLSLEYSAGVDNCDLENNDSIVVDSQSFQELLKQLSETSQLYIVVMGHYTDKTLQQAFVTREDIEFIPYSQLDAKLIPHLLSLSAR